MKKMFGISLVAALAALPMLANAAAGDVNKNPTADANGPVASANPKYALQPADTTNDKNVATAGYVKGAYNAAIKGVNAVYAEVEALESSINTDYATRQGVVATIDKATTSGSFTGANVEGAFNSASYTGTVTGTATGTITAMSEWGESTTSNIAVSGTMTNGAVTGKVDGTVSGSAAGSVSGNVSVDGYYATSSATAQTTF